MRDTERQRYRHREIEAPCGEPDVRLDSPRHLDDDLSQSRCSTTEAPRCLADSNPLLVMGLFIFFISSYFNFARLHISRHLSISSRSPSLLAYNLSWCSLIVVLFFWGWLWSLFSHLWFYLFRSFFSLMRLARAWSIFLIILKNHLFVSLFHSTALLILYCLFLLSSLFFPSSISFRLCFLFLFQVLKV